MFLRGGSWRQIPATILTAYPTAVLDAIETYQITYALLTNSLLNRVIAAAEQRGRNWQLSSLRRIALGGEMVVRDVVQRCRVFLARHGAARGIIRAGYGTTETGYLVEGADQFRSDLADGVVNLGRCAPGVRLRIVGQDGGVLEEGEIGEVQVSCPRKIFSCSGESRTRRGRRSPQMVGGGAEIWVVSKMVSFRSMEGQRNCWSSTAGSSLWPSY